MKQLIYQLLHFLLSRDEATRTPDPYVPNVVRYQLRYIPNDFAKSPAKVHLFSELRAKKQEKSCSVYKNVRAVQVTRKVSCCCCL